jgi:hypothetical protein
MSMKCSACGDIAFGRRQKLPCCKDCLRVSNFKFESALDEMRRINIAERELKLKLKLK